MSTVVWRVRDAASFRALRHGRRARSGPITVTWVADRTEPPPRLAFAIGRPVGTAVIRNRIRRRLRAAFTELAPCVSPGTYLVSATPAAAAHDAAALRRDLTSALAELGSVAS